MQGTVTFPPMRKASKCRTNTRLTKRHNLGRTMAAGLPSGKKQADMAARLQAINSPIPVR